MNSRVCVHEVSHAIAARSVGQRVRFAKVFGDGSGACAIAWTMGDSFDWRDALLVTVSGVIGERVMMGSAEFDRHELTRARNWIEAIRQMTPGTLQCIVEQAPEFIEATRKADQLLREHRGVVLQLSRKLEREHVLTGSEIEELATSRSPAVLRARIALEMNP